MEDASVEIGGRQATSHSDGLRLKLVAVAVAGAALSVASAALALSNPAAADRVTVAVVSVLLVSIPVGVGIYAWEREPRNRFGALLVASGFLWGITSLSASDSDVLYSIGRVSLWAAEAGLLYTMLAFPTGRLSSRAERAVVLAICLLVLTLYLPTAFISEQYVLPFPLTTCTDGCPSNAFMLTDSEPAFLGGIEDVRDVLAILLFTAAVSILALRIKRETPLIRPMLVPVLAIAIVRLLATAAYQLMAGTYPDSPLTEVVGWMSGFGIPAMAIAFLVGLINWRMVEATTLEQVTGGLRSDLGPETLQSVISRSAIGGSVRILYRAPGATAGGDQWVDGAGLTAQLPAAGSSQAVARYGSGENRVAVVHGQMLHGQRKFLDAIAACATASLENQRLATALHSSLQDVADSRARISAAADDERRRIERDLHDGAQQQLVTLGIKLELIAGMIERDPERAAEQLHAAGTRLTDILDEVRSLARGIYPPLLVDAGLDEALVAAGRRCAVPTKVDCEGVGRYPPGTESAVYFCCLEALQNASKHADGTASIAIRVRESAGELRFEVSDDGAGFDSATTSNGGGLTNMNDRVAALGGRLSVLSSPGAGTRVIGTIPVRRRADHPTPGTT